jgi:hypothetical protein
MLTPVRTASREVYGIARLLHGPEVIQRQRRLWSEILPDHSHSIVAGGLPLMS